MERFFWSVMRIWLVLVLALLLVASPRTDGLAETVKPAQDAWVVTSTMDHGPGSLREALRLVQSGDVITFDPAVFPPEAPATIWLESSLPALVTGDVTIDAANAGVILDGARLDRHENPAFLDDIQLTLKDDKNQIINGNFETDLDHWYVWQSSGQDNYRWNGSYGARELGAFEIVPKPRYGESILVYIADLPKAEFSTDAFSYPITIPFASEDELTLSLWHQNAQIGVDIFFLLPDGSQQVFGDTIPKSDTWQQTSLQVEIPPGATGCSLSFIIYPNFLHGLWITSDDNLIQGLQIVNFPGEGIFVDGAAGNRIGGDRGSVGGPCDGPCNLISGNILNGVFIQDGESNALQGNFIGTSLNGTGEFGNKLQGVRLFNAQDNIIGGEGGLANLIGSNEVGVEINLPESYSNQVIGNWIGLDLSGQRALGNRGAGISIAFGAHDNLVQGNVIVGNNTGIVINSESHHNILTANHIGSDVEGNLALGNLSDGIQIMNGANQNQVGPENRIMANEGSGVYILGQDTLGNRITQNSIIGNDGQGIQIDELTGDWMEPPQSMTVTSRRIYGVSQPDTVLEFYVSPDGEGAQYLGQTTTRDDGSFQWIVTSGTGLDPGVTVLAFDGEGTTSPFSSVYSPVEAVLKELPGLQGPDQISKDPKVVGLNLVFSLFSLIYCGLVATYFNETLENYSQEIYDLFSKPWQRLINSLPFQRWSSVRPNRMRTVLLNWLVIVTLIAAIQAFLNPVPPFSLLYFSTLLTIALSGLVVSGLQALSEWVLRRRLGEIPLVHQTEVRWIGLILAGISTVVSRALRFVPGFVLGAVDTFYFLPELERERAQGIRALVVKTTVLILTFLGWLLSPLAGRLSASLESLLLTIFLVGLEYAFFELIPLDVLDGASLFRWNRAAWGSLSLASMFGMYHFVLNPNSADVQAFRQNGIRTVIVVMLSLLILAAGLRMAVVLYQRRKNEAHEDLDH